MKKIFSILFLSVLFIGCTTVKEVVKEVPVEVIMEVEKTVYVHDTTYTKDSVIVYQKGDTIFKEKLIYFEKYFHNKNLVSHFKRHHTACIAKTICNNNPIANPFFTPHYPSTAHTEPGPFARRLPFLQAGIYNASAAS